MRKIVLSSLVFVFAAFVLASCNKNTPKDVAYTWLTDFNHFDFDAAKKLSTADTKNLLASLQQLTDKITDSNKKDRKKVTVNIKSVKEDGDKAVATYTSSDEPNKEQTLNLVKQGSTWLVEFSKIDLMGEAQGAEEDTPAGVDSTGVQPADTTIGADSSGH